MRTKNLTFSIFLLFIIFLIPVLAFYEFTDSRGQCWRCYQNAPCERCPRFSRLTWPEGWSDMCYEPNCNDPESRRFLFPSRESDRYFKCVLDKNYWTSESIHCPCGRLFDMRSQSCVEIKNWSPYCVELITPVTVRSCINGRRVPINNFNEEVDDIPTTIWEPTTPSTSIATTTWPDTTTPKITPDPDPDQVTTTPTPKPDPDSGTTTPSGAPTAFPPCNCVMWWPCWCNPCWMKPCHSCNGCFGMMG